LKNKFFRIRKNKNKKLESKIIQKILMQLLNQLTFFSKIRFFFLKFQDYPVEQFMENLMAIAKKKI